jgi:hypothetical protein
MQRKHGQLNKFKFGNNFKNNTKNKLPGNKEVTARRLSCEIKNKKG